MQTKIFMCPPDYFSIDYAINPWMTAGDSCSLDKTMKQWETLKNLFTDKLGAEVLTMTPQKGLPDIVFTANAAVVYKDTAIISRFRFDERKGEEAFYAQWFKENGYNVVMPPDSMSFEGAGDALFSGDVLFSGYMPRTDISAHAFIAELLKIEVLSLELKDQRFYHLDTCFCPLEGGYVIYYPQAFDEYANKVIENYFPEEKRITVTEDEACKFSCNAVNIGNAVIMNKTTLRLRNELERKGFALYEVDLSEFIKAGGSAKCLTLKLSK